MRGLHGSRRSGLSCAEVLIVVFVGLVSLAFAMPALMTTRHGSSRAKCANNLRQLGLAAMMYSDTHRYFPHVGPIRQLQGGFDSSDGPRVVRTLMWAGYHDNPEGFICPQSEDQHLPVPDATKVQMSLWCWGGVAASTPEVSPLVGGAKQDPTLRSTAELSYGWTRRGLNSNVRSSAALGGDRSCGRGGDSPQVDQPGDVGNHPDGIHRMQADGTVSWIAGDSPGVELITAVEGQGADALGIAPVTIDADAIAAAAHRRRMDELRRSAIPWLIALIPPAVVAGLLEAFGRIRRLARGGEPPPPALYGGVRPVRPSKVETLGPAERAALRLGEGPPPDGKVKLDAEQRCPRCQDVVSVDAALTRCAACSAVFHATCVAVGGSCPTPGCPG